MLRDNTNLWGSNKFSCAHGFQITLQSSVDIGSNKSTWKRISASPLPTDDAALLASFGSDICCALGLFVSRRVEVFEMMQLPFPSLQAFR